MAGINAPHVSRWFDLSRGSALALISSGTYLAGAVCPPIFERAIAAYGWRQTMWNFGLIEMSIIVRWRRYSCARHPIFSRASAGALADPKPGPVLGWPPNLFRAVRRCLPVVHTDGALILQQALALFTRGGKPSAPLPGGRGGHEKRSR
jgi:hypothetical protein